MAYSSLDREGFFGRRTIGCTAILLVLAAPAGGDWLITLEGRVIETRGPWTIDGETLSYVDPDGGQHVLDVADVDLEASEETTALRAGKPYVPRHAEATTGEAEEPATEKPGRSARKTRKSRAAKPDVILYMSSLCRTCTLARELLEELEVEFISKDINASSRARREYRKKAGHGGGLPVLDIGGTMVFSYNPRAIRQRVEELRKRKEAAADAE